MNKLIQKIIERFKKKWPDYEDIYEHSKVIDFLKTELTNIVKESFKNTRIEEQKFTTVAGEYTFGNNQKTIGYNTALSDIKTKQEEWINN